MLALALQARRELSQVHLLQLTSPFSPARHTHNSSELGQQQPDFTLNSIYFLRKDTRVWEMTEGQLRGPSRTQESIPLGRSPQPELLLTDTHQTCSPKPPQTVAPNLPRKAVQQITHLSCQSIHPGRKKTDSPPSSCRGPLS